jgi:hypothetical protein
VYLLTLPINLYYIFFLLFFLIISILIDKEASIFKAHQITHGLKLLNSNDNDYENYRKNYREWRCFSHYPSSENLLNLK